LYYPLWQAAVDGEKGEITSLDGALGVNVGSQNAKVELQFIEPEYTHVSRWISLLAWTAAVFIIIWTFFRDRKLRIN
jgi:uncharacterized membrane protein YfhO